MPGPKLYYKKPKKKRRAKKPRTEQNIKVDFFNMMRDAGIMHKKAPIFMAPAKHKEHLDQYGPPELYTADAPDRDVKRLCGICGEPDCPWSD